ncbi:flagellar biosynthetic protein FliO [Endozoicomonas sp. Mp262]|uniref:flagellar biosynthetic protein FliO n=1 Tax=Endozoicomonas sp. Mp262 TaxID=2919499 RepID=UPI0021D8BB77
MKAIMILLSLVVLPALAEPSPVTEMSAMQVITPLLLVIALIFLLAWLVKKVNPGQTAMGKDIMVIASTPVSNQARLCLVRVGGKDILVGVTAQQVTRIETFNEPVVDQPANSSPHDLSQQFRKLMKRDKGEKS